jgi:hypothetical protein
MPQFEYKVVPAPRRGEKAREAKTTEERYALALTNLMNAMGREGWQYLRADTLPVDERVGFTGTKTTYQNMLVFGREIAEAEHGEAIAPPARILSVDATPVAAPKLGPAEKPAGGVAPAVGPASSAEVAAE